MVDVRHTTDVAPGFDHPPLTEHELPDENDTVAFAPGFDHTPLTEHDLPDEDDSVPESNLHDLNPTLLRFILEHYLTGRRDAFIGTDMFVYYSEDQPRRREFLAPDFFVVLDQPMEPHKSWVMWQQGGRGPDLVIEMLSDSTRANDLGKKRDLYRERLRVPEVFWFDPWTGQLDGVRLVCNEYRPIAKETDGSLTSVVLGLKLVLWEGAFGRLHNRWLRWATPDGTLLPTPDEAAAAVAEREREAAEREREAAEREREAAAQARLALEQEQHIAEHALQRAADLEAQLARYREQFGELPG